MRYRGMQQYVVSLACALAAAVAAICVALVLSAMYINYASRNSAIYRAYSGAALGDFLERWGLRDRDNFTAPVILGVDSAGNCVQWHVVFADENTLMAEYRGRTHDSKKLCTGFCDRNAHEVWVRWGNDGDMERTLGHEIMHILYPQARHDSSGAWENLKDEIEKGAQWAVIR